MGLTGLQPQSEPKAAHGPPSGVKATCMVHWRTIVVLHKQLRFSLILADKVKCRNKIPADSVPPRHCELPSALASPHPRTRYMTQREFWEDASLLREPAPRRCYHWRNRFSEARSRLFIRPQRRKIPFICGSIRNWINEELSNASAIDNLRSENGAINLQDPRAANHIYGYTAPVDYCNEDARDIIHRFALTRPTMAQLYSALHECAHTIPDKRYCHVYRKMLKEHRIGDPCP